MVDNPRCPAAKRKAAQDKRIKQARERAERCAALSQGHALSADGNFSADALVLIKEGNTRPRGVLKQRSRFLVACEGLVTEPDYLFGLAKRCKLKLDVKKAAGAPLGMLDAVRKQKNKGRYDQVWLVFDKDAIPDEDIERTFREAERDSVKIAFSNPCFELWLLLHFQSTSLNGNCSNLTVTLRNHLLGYNKALTDKHHQALQSRLLVAVANAKELVHKEQSRRDVCTQVPSCPYTTMHELVLAMCGDGLACLL